ncbi:MAG: hypothetical protein KDC24_14265 [Saprospiraceae bacterium]|nr:hypothetical protein [Saprospiraceae bacterium]
MRTAYLLFFLFAGIFVFPTTTSAQTINFDETWKEFLENNKIANMSALARPDKNYNPSDYAKYLLMNTNNSFCQSDIEDAEEMMGEIMDMKDNVYDTIAGYKLKRNELDSRIKAYYEIDKVWQRFLKTKDVHPDELEDILPPRTICEKQTLVKYSYMTAHYYLCEGDIEKAEEVFQGRTMKLVNKTSLRTRDVKGLDEEVDRMSRFFKGLPKLNEAWETYMNTGESPGFDLELPVFTCYPTPNMKEYILKGVFDVCGEGKSSMKKIKDLQAKSGAALDWEVRKKLKDLESAVAAKDDEVRSLNKSWKDFVETSQVSMGKYGYDYCDQEALIRAYIMDGFAFVCELSDEMLDKIDKLQSTNFTPLEESTLEKIDELEELKEQYNSNGVKIETIWNTFVAEGDILYDNYESTDFYCDNIQQVKDWLMKGLAANCETSIPYLERIEEFQATFEFSFSEEVECRVQKLRRKVWDCRFEVLQNLARVEAEGDAYEQRLQELMEEYNLGEKPELCGGVD